MSLGHTECVKILLDHHANANTVNKKGWNGERIFSKSLWKRDCSRTCAPLPCAKSDASYQMQSHENSVFLSVCQEAVSTGDPEILSHVFRQRDFQRASQRLDGIPELLDDLNAVRLHDRLQHHS